MRVDGKDLRSDVLVAVLCAFEAEAKATVVGG